MAHIRADLPTRLLRDPAHYRLRDALRSERPAIAPRIDPALAPRPIALSRDSQTSQRQIPPTSSEQALRYALSHPEELARLWRDPGAELQALRDAARSEAEDVVQPRVRMAGARAQAAQGKGETSQATKAPDRFGKEHPWDFQIIEWRGRIFSVSSLARRLNCRPIDIVHRIAAGSFGE